jgi:opacity protein-like surface antigen
VTGRLALLVILFHQIAASADAQAVTLAPTNPTRWDTAVSVGWLGGNKEDIAEPWNEWYDTFATSVDVGRYWTSHLKTELGATFTSEGGVYSQEQFAVPGQPSPVFFSREHRYAVKALTLGAAYQFFENSWVHPFVAGGVQLAWERHHIETPFPLVFGRDGRSVAAPPADGTRRTTFDPQPLLSCGAKFYISERGFIRSDITAAVDRGATARVSWRIGGGIDF